MINDLKHVRAFLTAARVGNFTRAAGELHVSQSAFTTQIRQLEEALGVALFDRSKRRISLTSAGREVLAPLERILIDIEAVVGRTQQLAGLRRGMVTVAVLPSLAAQLLPRAIQRFNHLHPGIVVQIRDVVAEKLIEAVKKDEVDFGIGSRIRMDRELKTSPLLVDKLCGFLCSTHPLCRRESVSLADLVAFPMILTGKDSSVREIVDRALKRENLQPTIAFETNYMSTAISLARAGLGVAVLPETAADIDGVRAIRTVVIRKPSLSRKIEIIQRKDRSLSPAALRLAEVLKGIVA